MLGARLGNAYFDPVHAIFWSKKHFLQKKSFFKASTGGNDHANRLFRYGLLYKSAVKSSPNLQKTHFPKKKFLASLRGRTFIFWRFGLQMKALSCSKPFLKSRLAWSFPPVDALKSDFDCKKWFLDQKIACTGSKNAFPSRAPSKFILS